MPRHGEIDLEPFRERFRTSGMTIAEIARRMERDPEYVRRIMGGGSYYKYYRGRRYGPYTPRRTSYEQAAKLARAMNVDPYEMGL
jgi:hypothetical protein